MSAINGISSHRTVAGSSMIANGHRFELRKEQVRSRYREADVFGETLSRRFVDSYHTIGAAYFVDDVEMDEITFFEVLGIQLGLQLGRRVTVNTVR